jgi:hypothetical protein
VRGVKIIFPDLKVLSRLTIIVVQAMHLFCVHFYEVVKLAGLHYCKNVLNMKSKSQNYLRTDGQTTSLSW